MTEKTGRGRYPRQKYVMILVALTPEQKERLKAAATARGNSVASEVRLRLAASFAQESSA